MTAEIKLTVNGQARAASTETNRTLLDYLREDLHLTGTKFGCGEGDCRACTVLVDGKPVRSCLTKIGSLQDKKVETIESLASGDKLHPVQEAFLKEEAMQCGYCVSGILISAAALLKRNPSPTSREVKEALDRNLCRCGSQNRMVRAVLRAAEEMAAG